MGFFDSHFFQKVSIVLSLDLEISFGVLAHGANLRSLGANHDVTAVGALPNLVAIAAEYQSILHVG